MWGDDQLWNRVAGFESICVRRRVAPLPEQPSWHTAMFTPAIETVFTTTAALFAISFLGGGATVLSVLSASAFYPGSTGGIAFGAPLVTGV